jgi:hypothetical protein
MSRPWSGAVDALLLVTSTILIVAPEFRILPLQIAQLALWAWTVGSYWWRLHKAGVLGRTPRAIFHMDRRPRTDLLTFAAILAGTFAIILASH